ncbi:MAG: hypothetical protein ACR2HN_00525 [Tepidiformaceae bacterium]
MLTSMIAARVLSSPIAWLGWFVLWATVAIAGPRFLDDDRLSDPQQGASRPPAAMAEGQDEATLSGATVRVTSVAQSATQTDVTLAVAGHDDAGDAVRLRDRAQITYADGSSVGARSAQVSGRVVYIAFHGLASAMFE